MKVSRRMLRTVASIHYKMVGGDGGVVRDGGQLSECCCASCSSVEGSGAPKPESSDRCDVLLDSPAMDSESARSLLSVTLLSAGSALRLIKVISVRLVISSVVSAIVVSIMSCRSINPAEDSSAAASGSRKWRFGYGIGGRM